MGQHAPNIHSFTKLSKEAPTPLLKQHRQAPANVSLCHCGREASGGPLTSDKVKTPHLDFPGPARACPGSLHLIILHAHSAFSFLSSRSCSFLSLLPSFLPSLPPSPPSFLPSVLASSLSYAISLISSFFPSPQIASTPSVLSSKQASRTNRFFLHPHVCPEILFRLSHLDTTLLTFPS